MNDVVDLYDPARDLEGCVRTLSLAFGGSPDHVREWLCAKHNPRCVRVIRESGRPVATGCLIPMGQYYGGLSVPMTGIAGIAIEPEARGRGLATRLMRGLLEELRRDRVAISSLYPATTRLYRSLGYEQAGQHFEHAYPVSRIAARRAALKVRAFESERLEAVMSCHREWARPINGALDRSDYIWDRVQTPSSGACTGFVVDDPVAPSGVGGYVFLRQDRDPKTGRFDLHLTDLVAVTPNAAASLMSFIGEFGSMAEQARITAGAMHPLFALLDEPRYLSIRFKDYWMLRIVDVEQAMTLRGYPAHLSATLDIDLTDELLAANSGRWRLVIQHGRATLERGGGGSLRTDIRGLSQLFSGQFHPTTLASLGRLEGDAASLATAAVAFGSCASAGFCDFF